MKKVLNLIIVGMLLGTGVTHWVQAGLEPVEYQAEIVPEQPPEPRPVKIKIDYSGWDTKRIQQEILAELPAVFLKIAECESNTRQYYKGTDDVVRGQIDEDDTGLFQINKRYHLETAEAMWLDIYQTPDNIAFAKYLYERDGLSPWNASRSCWE